MQRFLCFCLPLILCCCLCLDTLATTIPAKTKHVPVRVQKTVTWSKSSNLSLWYKKWELCILNQTTPIKNFKTLAKAKCRKKRPLFRCRLGNTLWCKKAYLDYKYLYV